VSYPPQAGTRVHTHVGDPQGGQLDVDNIFSDLVHSHESAGEGGTLPSAALPGLATHEADVDAHHPVDIGARVYNSADQAIPNATWTALTFDSERYDTDTIHSTSSNTSRLTCKTAGKYLIHAQVQWEGNADSTRYVSIKHSSGWHIGREIATGFTATGFIMSVQTVFDLAVDEYVELELWQGSGVSLDAKAEGQITPEFMMQRIED